MIPIDVAATFFGFAILLALTPGPDNIFVLTQSALQGRLAGVIVTLGLSTGIIVHTSAVALGVAAVFATSATAFSVLKWIGAGYLLFLAWQSFRASASKIDWTEKQRPALSKLYGRGFIMNVTNPKVSLFFLAFLPQFADPARGSLPWQMIQFGLLFIVATLLIFGSIAILAGVLGEKLSRSNRAQVILNRIAGTIFAGLALKLATAQR